MSCHKCFLLCVMFTVQDRHSDRHKDSRLNLRPPSHSATYATVSAWHHQPEKLILDSCGYEATVSHFHSLQTRSRQTFLFIFTAYSQAPSINQIVGNFLNNHQQIWKFEYFFRKWSKFSDPSFLNINFLCIVDKKRHLRIPSWTLKTDIFHHLKTKQLLG